MDIIRNRQFSIQDIRITNVVISLGSLIERLRDRTIFMNHNMDYRWGENKMSRLIESILLKIPIPALYFDVSNPNRWISIDGIHPLNAIKRFVIDDNLQLIDMELLSYLNNSYYGDLDNSYKRMIYDTQIITYQIEAQTPHYLKKVIYEKIRDMNDYR